MKVKVMVDIETLGTATNSVVFAIGAAKFNNDKVTDHFYRRIDIKSCKKLGLTVDNDTVDWWSKQSKEAQKELIDPKDRIPIIQALKEFDEWINTVPENIQIWGNGALFDIGILENCYRAAKLPIPWSYKGVMCYRTLRTLLESPMEEKHHYGEFHNAVDDAHSQALHLIDMLKS